MCSGQGAAVAECYGAGRSQALDLAGQEAGREAKKPRQARKMSGKCWMAAGFPMSLGQLIPILDIISHTNKHLGRVSKFMRKYGDMHLFPIKVQVCCSGMCIGF